MLKKKNLIKSLNLHRVHVKLHTRLVFSSDPDLCWQLQQHVLCSHIYSWISDPRPADTDREFEEQDTTPHSSDTSEVFHWFYSPPPSVERGRTNRQTAWMSHDTLHIQMIGQMYRRLKQSWEQTDRRHVTALVVLQRKKVPDWPPHVIEEQNLPTVWLNYSSGRETALVQIKNRRIERSKWRAALRTAQVENSSSTADHVTMELRVHLGLRSSGTVSSKHLLTSTFTVQFRPDSESPMFKTIRTLFTFTSFKN